MVICVPSSTKRLPGMLKNSVAGVALRDISRNNLSRHRAIPLSLLAVRDSRLPKKVVSKLWSEPWFVPSNSPGLKVALGRASEEG